MASKATAGSVIIIGGGLVGSLCSIFMARRGYNVSVFEYREDIRAAKFVRGKSINMAVSNRGLCALAAVGLDQAVLESAIPMKGRLLHDTHGKTKSVLYDPVSGQCIYSVSRNYLNKLLLCETERYPAIKIFFGYKLIGVNFEDETVTLLNLKTQKAETHTADLIIGADGAFSTLRRFMQLTPLFEFSQSYIMHGYVELQIPPERGSLLTPNHLHIWPRKKFMMIALPNPDNSWTVTLFLAFLHFESLRNKTQLVDFFQESFPDALSLIGERFLVEDFFRAKPAPVVSIKSKPYHVGRKFLIIGDAAHAMVPFYGQGMNAGFEDCRIFDQMLEESKDQIGRALKEYSARRVDDGHAICDLAMYNYVEMSDLVTKRTFYLRKFLDNVFYKLFPHKWIPLYNSVTFSSIGYKKCADDRRWQNMMIERLIWLLLFTLVAILAFAISVCWNYQ